MVVVTRANGAVDWVDHAYNSCSSGQEAGGRNVILAQESTGRGLGPELSASLGHDLPACQVHSWREPASVFSLSSCSVA